MIYKLKIIDFNRYWLILIIHFTNSDSVSLGSSPGSPATSKAKSLKTNELGFFVLWNLLALLINLLINTL